VLVLTLAVLAQETLLPSLPDESTELSHSARVEATSTQMLHLSQAALARGEVRFAVELLKALLADPDLRVRNEARFRLAMLAVRDKRWNDAGTYLRAMLDEEPGAQRARLELARVQAEMGQIDASRRTLREAQAGGLPPEIARQVERFSAALREHKPVGANLQLAIAPDSNINRATRSDTLGTVIGDFELDKEARQSSGVGLSLDGEAYFRQGLSERTSLLVRAGFSGDLYRAGQFDDMLAIVSAGPEFPLHGGRATLLAGAQRRWFGGQRFYDALDANLQWQRAAGRRAQVRAGLSYSYNNYRINDLQDSDTLSGYVTYERAFGQRTGASFTLGGSRQMAADPAYSTASGYLSATGWQNLGRSTLFASTTFQRLESDKRLAIYPKRRKEDFLRFSLGATLRSFSWKGWAPQLKLVWEKNWSPIEIYHYNRWRGEFGVTRAF